MQDRNSLALAPYPPPAREINNGLPDPLLNKPRPDRLHATEHSRALPGALPFAALLQFGHFSYQCKEHE